MNGVFVVGRYGFDRDAAADRSRQSAIGYNVERDGKIVGTVADVRCAFLSGVGLDASVEQVMNRTPILAALGISNAAALTLMRRHSINQLPIVDAEGRITEVRLIDDLAVAPPYEHWVVLMAGNRAVPQQRLGTT